MFGLGAGEMLIIVAFALIFIGPKKLPELARNLGKGLREFQKAKDEFMHHVENEKAEIDQQLSEVDGDAGSGDEDHDPKLTDSTLTGVNEPDPQGSSPQGTSDDSNNVGHHVSEEEVQNEVAAIEKALNKKEDPQNS